MDKVADVAIPIVQVEDVDANVRTSAVAAMVTNIVTLMVAAPMVVMIVRHQDPSIVLKRISTT